MPKNGSVNSVFMRFSITTYPGHLTFGSKRRIGPPHKKPCGDEWPPMPPMVPIFGDIEIRKTTKCSWSLGRLGFPGIGFPKGYGFPMPLPMCGMGHRGHMSRQLGAVRSRDGELAPKIQTNLILAPLQRFLWAVHDFQISQKSLIETVSEWVLEWP